MLQKWECEMQDVILKKIKFPFDDDSQWVILLNGDPFCRYPSARAARIDAKKFDLRIVA